MVVERIWKAGKGGASERCEMFEEVRNWDNTRSYKAL